MRGELLIEIVCGFVGLFSIKGDVKTFLGNEFVRATFLVDTFLGIFSACLFYLYSIGGSFDVTVQRVCSPALVGIEVPHYDKVGVAQ